MYVRQTDFEGNYVRRILKMHVLVNLLVRLTVSIAPTGVRSLFAQTRNEASKTSNFFDENHRN